MQMKNKLVLNKELYSYSYIGQAIMVYKRLTDIGFVSLIIANMELIEQKKSLKTI